MVTTNIIMATAPLNLLAMRMSEMKLNKRIPGPKKQSDEIARTITEEIKKQAAKTVEMGTNER